MYLIILAAAALTVALLYKFPVAYGLALAVLAVLVALPLLMMRTNWQQYADFADANWRLLSGNEVSDGSSLAGSECRGTEPGFFASLAGMLSGLFALALGAIAVAAAAAGVVVALVSVPTIFLPRASSSLRKKAGQLLALGLVGLLADGLIWRAAEALTRFGCSG